MQIQFSDFITTELPIFIETTVEKNKRVYERIGFRVHEERVVSGFKTYCMVRDYK